MKVRVGIESRSAREELLGTLADALGAAAVQHIGKLLVLWRPPAPKQKADKEGRFNIALNEPLKPPICSRRHRSAAATS